MRFHLLVFIIALSAGPAMAQSVNLDIGDHFGTPPETFAGAGQAGLWNAVPTSSPILDISGKETTITFDGLSEAVFQDGAATGSEEALLEDGVSLGDVVVRVTLSGLQDGVYEVILYGIVTGDASARTTFWIQGEEALAGGEWTGTFDQAVTHALLNAEVERGVLDIDMVGGFAFAGFCNGMQLDYLGPVDVEPSSWGQVKTRFELR